MRIAARAARVGQWEIRDSVIDPALVREQHDVREQLDGQFVECRHLRSARLLALEVPRDRSYSIAQRSQTVL